MEMKVFVMIAAGVAAVGSFAQGTVSLAPAAPAEAGAQDAQVPMLRMRRSRCLGAELERIRIRR